MTEESDIATGKMYSEDLLGAAQTGKMNKKNLLTTTPVGDLTNLQWYLADTGNVYNTPYASESNYMLNVPGWAAVAAGSLDDWIYVLAPDTTENEAAYFRASNIKRSKPTPEPGPTPGEGGDGNADKNANGTSGGSGETRKVPKAPKTGDKICITKVLGL